MQLCTNNAYFYFGWNGKLSEIERPNHYVFYDETADSIEVSLASESSSFHFRDDTEYISDAMGCILTDNSQCTKSINNIPAFCNVLNESEPESSSVSSSEESISSQRSYLQLAIPSPQKFIDKANGIDDSHDNEYKQVQGQTVQPKVRIGTCQEEPRNLETAEAIDQVLKSDGTTLQQEDEKSHSFGTRQDESVSHGFLDSQGVIYYPKQRAIFWGPRQSKMSLHSRMEFWRHQLSKPIRALKVGRKSLRPPFRSDCLGRSVVNTISKQPTSSTDIGLDDDSQIHFQDDLVETMAERGIDGFTEISKERRNWFIRASPNHKHNNECLAHKAITDAPLVRNGYDMRPAARHAAAAQKIMPFSCHEYSWSDSSVGKQNNPPDDSTPSNLECPKRIIVIDFDETALARHGPTEEDSTDNDDDESVLILDWDLG